MKKSLFALAALGAFASAAQAQSTVTLYGTYDASVAYMTSVKEATSAFTSVTSTVTGGSGLAYIDSSWATSSWGLRGSEDLGGGMKANFNAESDIMTNNGQTNVNGLFRRAANVSLSDAKLGEVFLGRRGSAFIIATGQMLPVSGNTAHQWRTVAGASIGDQVSNSISYATPTIMGTNVLVQYGINNTIDNGDDGTVFSSHLVNRSIKNLQIISAYNQMTGIRTANTTTGQGSASAANATTNNREGYALGLKYKATPAIEVGTFYAHGRGNNGGSASAASTGYTTGVAGIGLGYQASPSLLLGANFVKTTFQAQMTNLQAHYSLSKRTRLYSQITLTQAAKGNNQVGAAAANSFSPIACNNSPIVVATVSATPTTTSSGCHNGLAGSAGSGNVPLNSNAYNIGVIHTF